MIHAFEVDDAVMCAGGQQHDKLGVEGDIETTGS